jgi:hypothetical protein
VWAELQKKSKINSDAAHYSPQPLSRNTWQQILMNSCCLFLSFLFWLQNISRLSYFVYFVMIRGGFLNPRIRYSSDKNKVNQNLLHCANLNIADGGRWTAVTQFLTWR